MPGIDILTQLGAAGWTTADADRLRHAQQRARFDLMGVASRRALTGDLRAGNAEVRALVETDPALRGWVVINPLYPERSQEEMRRYLHGSRWLGAMLHPGMCCESLASSTTREVLNAFRRYAKPLLVHISGEQSTRELEAVATEFSSLKFIASGGGGEDWQDCALVAKRAVNVFIEPFSGGTHRAKIEAILATLGPNRILFGSNYPEMNPGAALGLLVDSRISDGDRANILTNNARRLFNLNRPVEE